MFVFVLCWFCLFVFALRLPTVHLLFLYWYDALGNEDLSWQRAGAKECTF